MAHVVIEPSARKEIVSWSGGVPVLTAAMLETLAEGRSNGSKLANKRLFIDPGQGTPDGFRVDVDGNLWCGWGMGEGMDGVMIFSPEGKPIGKILLPERAANVCFGGVRRNRLFMAASHSLYSLYVNTQGAPGG